MDTRNIVLFVCALVAFSKAESQLKENHDSVHQEINNAIWKELNNLRAQMNEHHDTIVILESANAKQEETIKEQHNAIVKLEHANAKQEEKIKSLSREVTRLNSRTGIKEGVAEYQENQAEHLQASVMGNVELQQNPDRRNQHTTLGCLNDVIPLSCPNERTILVTSATYGMYAHECSGGCCAPNPVDDCTEIASENDPNDWVALKYLCDNQTDCEYQYTGTTINNCQEGYIADYMQIFYNCQPDEAEGPIGFTAYAKQSREYLDEEIVIFDGVRSNFGGHYNGATSTFQCPHNGVYLFSVNFNNVQNYPLYVVIRKDDFGLSSAWADNMDGVHNQASAVIVAECNAGQTIWVQAESNGQMFGSGDGRSHFTGYLLYRYT